MEQPLSHIRYSLPSNARSLKHQTHSFCGERNAKWYTCFFHKNAQVGEATSCNAGDQQVNFFSNARFLRKIFTTKCCLWEFICLLSPAYFCSKIMRKATIVHTTFRRQDNVTKIVQETSRCLQVACGNNMCCKNSGMPATHLIFVLQILSSLDHPLFMLWMMEKPIKICPSHFDYFLCLK